MVMCVCAYTDYYANWIHLLMVCCLSFIECPSWCRGSGRCLNESDCCQVYDRNLTCASNCSNNDDLVDSNYVCRK